MTTPGADPIAYGGILAGTVRGLSRLEIGEAGARFARGLDRPRPPAPSLAIGNGGV